MSVILSHFIHAARVWSACIVWVLMAFVSPAQTVSTTTVQGTVYLANGLQGSGTLQLSWPAFTTASNQAVAAGKQTASIGADGFVSVNLAPNLGSTPAGLFYTAIYHLSDGSTSTEYWVVPAAAQASIAQVRSQVMPAAQAVQAVSKAYVDQAIQSLADGNLTSTGGQLTGPLYLTGDPTQPLQAADKHYVDLTFGQAMPLAGGAATGPLTAKQLGAAYQVDQFAGADFGAKLQACVNTLSSAYGGTCDARNVSGNISMATDLTISTANATVLLPCATISTASRIVATAGTRNVSLRGCSLRGSSGVSGTQGGTVLLYSGSSAAVQVGDSTYAVDTPGFHLENVLINTTASSSGSAQAIAAYRTQEMDLESLYLLGNANQTGMTLDGTGNYTGGTFYDNHISGFKTALNALGHQVTNPAATDWLNASTFVRLHINCPTTNGNPIDGTYGINLQQGDGNSFTGGDVEGCATAVHLGANAQNNTIVGLRNENSTYQVVADAGSSYNSWMTGGTMFTGKLSDSGTRNSFLDTFHRSFNSLNGDWYGSQQDSTVTNHFRLGIGNGNERGLLDRYQTDYGYRWTMGLSDATGGEQFYQVLDELNNVYRISIGQYNKGQSSTNNQTVINSAGTGAVVLNGSNNSGTGGVVFGSGGSNETTVATVSNSGNAQFNGTLQVGGTTQSAGTMTVRNNADAEVDYYLWPGLTTSQKGAFTYKDFNGNSQWYMVKDASNNWALNSATGGLDSFKAYQSTNSGDTYINASNSSGVVRVNYESGSGSAFNVYGGNSGNLYASFSGNTSIKFPGLAASSGRNCLQIDSSGFITNTGAACGSGSGGGTVNAGSAGQIAYYTSAGAAVSGLSTVPVSAGGTGAATAAAGLQALGGVSETATTPQSMAGPLNVSINSQMNVIAFGAKGDCVTDDTAAFDAAQTAAFAGAPGSSPSALYLPKPPGGCYIINNWTYKGVPLIGQPSGLGPASPHAYNVKLKSTLGNDVLHVPDPLTTSGTIMLSAGWTIRDVSIDADASVSSVGKFPHRWPGRWNDLAGMTSGSAVLTGLNGTITCGDVGQAITVGGAGNTAATTTLGAEITSATQRSITLSNGYVSGTWPSVFMYLKIDGEIMLAEVQGLSNGTTVFTNVQRGQGGTTAATHANGAAVTILGNLTTSIQSVSPCWNSPTSAFTTVTLAAAAQNTVSNAHTYISVLGLPVTTNIGNCGIAIDLADAKSSDWIGTGSGGNYPRLENVVFTREGNAADSNTCGLYTQGNPNLYGAVVNNIGVYGLVFGIVQQTTELNPILMPSSGDYETWNHGLFFFNSYPWISSNGLSQRMTDLQFTGYAGPQILQAPNVAYDYAQGWHVSNSGFECPYNCTPYGWHVTGSGHNFDGVSLTAGAAGMYGYWDAVSSSGGIGGSNIYLNGYGNSFATASGNIIGGTWYNNTAFANYNANPYGGWPAVSNVAIGPYKGRYNLTGKFTGDFAFDGNGSVNYDHDDLVLFPQNIGTSNYANTIVQDASSPSGYYFNMAPGGGYSQFHQFEDQGIQGNSIIFGTTLPTTGFTVYFKAKCLSGSTFQFQAVAFGGSGNTGTYNCTASYQNYSLSVSLSSADAGKFLQIGVLGSTTIQASYFVLVPYQTFTSPTLNTPAINSPTITGTATAPTPAPGDNSTKIATTAFVAAAGVPQPWYDWAPYGEANPQGTSLASPVNATSVASFTAPTTATYTRISYMIQTADTSPTNLYGLGWYDSSGHLLCSTAPIAGSTFSPTAGQVYTVTFSSGCSFTAGLRYYFGWTGTASTAKYYCVTGAVFAARQGSVSGGTTAGAVLNSSVTPPADNYSGVNPVPWFVMHN
jgi:hypothetical protein